MSKPKVNNKFLFGILLTLSIAFTVLQPVASAIINHFAKPELNDTISLIASCIIFQFLIIVLIVFVVNFERNGLIISIIIVLFNMIGITRNFLISHNPMCIMSYVTNVMAIVILSVICYEIYRINSSAAKMHKLKNEDELTGLPNRSSLSEQITSKITLHPKESFSLLLINLDDFKMLNDSLGHQVGDIFLTETSNNLRSVLNEDDYLARIGGDEFMVITNGECPETEIYQFAKKLTSAISSPFIYRNKEIRITSTVGITQFPKDGSTVTELFQHADMAKYRGKAQGKQHILFYNETMQKTVEIRMSVENELKSALDNEEFYLVFQPQYDAFSHELRGFEALSRWNSKKLGNISPADFIPVAEQTGDIVPMGKWIMENACKQYMSTWGTFKIKPTLAINISARQLQDPDFVDTVKRILKKTGMPPECLELELTESVCIMNPEIINSIFAQLKNMGIEIAMDDFGTGYSSLSYLSNLPFDIVKIDTTFTRTILTTPPEKNLIKTIITMAHQLGLKVIAEGVELKEQLDYLLENKCDYIQGNYFAKPSPMSIL